MATKIQTWGINSKNLAIELHSQLSIKEKDWHYLKNNHKRRASELIAGAMVQLLSDGKLSDIEEMLEQSVLWLKKEIKDPGCPHH